MEITSAFLTSSDIGQLHMVRFEPEDAPADELMVVFNSINGRSTTIDGFAVPLLMAQYTGLTVDYIERPNTGLSEGLSAPLTDEFKKYGFLAVREAVAEAQLQDPKFKQAKTLHVGGFSIGGYEAVLYGDVVQDRLGSMKLVCAPGSCFANQAFGTGRYFVYKGAETIADTCKLKQSVGEIHAGQQAALDAYNKMYKHPEPPPLTRSQGLAELRESALPAKGLSLKLLPRMLANAATAGRKLELRASYSPMRVLTDPLTVPHMNKMLDQFDKEYAGQDSVTYGFLQRNGMKWWHNLATKPEVLEMLLKTPISGLRQRLRYFR